MNIIKNYPSKLKIEQTETIDKAILKAKKLVQLHQQFNSDAIIVYIVMSNIMG